MHANSPVLEARGCISTFHSFPSSSFSPLSLTQCWWSALLTGPWNLCANKTVVVCLWPLVCWTQKGDPAGRLATFSQESREKRWFSVKCNCPLGSGFILTMIPTLGTQCWEEHREREDRWFQKSRWLLRPHLHYSISSWMLQLEGCWHMTYFLNIQMYFWAI